MNNFPDRKGDIYFKLMGIKELKELGDTYSEDQIKQLAIELKWKGTGTSNDPLIIDNRELPQRIMISNSSMFINIMNCQFVNIIVDTCQNITFDKCSFEILGILGSSNILVNQSSISLLGIGQSSNNHFNECTITEGFNLNNKSNVFAGCVFNKKSRRIFQKDFNLKLFQEISGWFNLPKVIKQLPYAIIAYAIIFVVFFLLSGLNSILLIHWIAFIGLLLGLIAVYLFLARNAKTK
ncbi:hypothetical protein LCGC14_1718840 [marine sediment metagenome]|uniref:Uncharacterized protein n=1 Tax=marine sediment metagenome TaxID=412755 RepID=A0A0F9HDB8_9ZZZZ